MELQTKIDQWINGIFCLILKMSFTTSLISLHFPTRSIVGLLSLTYIGTCCNTFLLYSFYHQSLKYLLGWEYSRITRSIPESKIKKNSYRSDMQVSFKLYGHLGCLQVLPNKTALTKYCLTQLILRLTRGFEIHWVRQYLVNLMGLMGIVTKLFTRRIQFWEVSGMANCPNF